MGANACRHCREAIQPQARVCPHCHNTQSWWGNNRDPRFATAILVLTVVAMFAVFHFTSRTVMGDEPTIAPTLVLTQSSQRVVGSPEGPTLYVLGTLRNDSSRDAARVYIRVSLRDASGKLVDTLLAEDRGLVVPAGKTTPFRVSGTLATASIEGLKVEATVERAKAASKWD